MTSALILNNTVLALYQGPPPNELRLTNGDIVAGISDAAIGQTFTDGSQLLPAAFTDSAPHDGDIGGEPYTYTIADGQVSITRTWTTPTPFVPPSITNAQARQWLNNNGLLEQVAAAITAAGGNTLIKWEYANVIERSDPLITSLATQLGQTPEQVDAFFIAANQL